MKIALSTLTRRSLSGLVLAMGAPLFAATLHACSDEGSPDTGGKRVVLLTRADLAPGGAKFSNGYGWNVELSRALIATGAIYYFEGAPAVEAMRWVPRLQSLLGLTSAHAHPGHYQTGDALGQVLEPWSFDVLEGADLPAGDGVTGLYRSGSLSFAAPSAGPAAEELGEFIAAVEGTASKEGEDTRYFLAQARFDDVAKSVAEARVSGSVFEEITVETDGTVTITIRPEVWFRLVDFSVAETGEEGAPAEFASGTEPSIAFAQGLAQASAYSFVFTPSNP